MVVERAIVAIVAVVEIVAAEDEAVATLEVAALSGLTAPRDMRIQMRKNRIYSRWIHPKYRLLPAPNPMPFRRVVDA